MNPSHALSANASADARTAHRALADSALAWLVGCVGVAMFLPPLAAATAASLPRSVLAGLVVALALPLHWVLLGIGARRMGASVSGWVALSGIGALLVPQRRRDWLLVGVGAVAAHAAAIVIKLAVRRKRPHHRDIAVNVGTPSSLSFPSAHATSSTAAAMLLCRATRSPLPSASPAPPTPSPPRPAGRRRAQNKALKAGGET